MTRPPSSGDYYLRVASDPAVSKPDESLGRCYPVAQEGRPAVKRGPRSCCHGRIDRLCVSATWGPMQTCLEFGPHVPFPAPDRWIISVLSLNPIRNGVSAPSGGVLQESGIVLACPTMMHPVQMGILLRLHRGG